MKHALLHTKLQIPPVAPDIVPRNRLLTLLDEGGRRPLALITAPAGYGKTTLASCWANACGCPFGWVSLDREDDDLRQFLAYFLAAVQKAFPGIALGTEALLEAGQLPPEPVLSRYLLNDLYGLPEPFVLVLDDFHRMTDPSISGLVSDLLKHPARFLHLVLLSRTDPPLQVAPFRGRGLVTEVRASDLRLTLAEATAFMDKLLPVNVDDATASVLESKTEGWAAGLRLAGLYLQGGQDPRKKAMELSGISYHIADYLLAEVVSRLDSDTVSYLLETAVLNRFCAPLCRYMHQRRSFSHRKDSAEAFIDRLVESNLFTLGLDSDGYWFRFHHLFRELLNGMLKKVKTSQEIADLHRTAGAWFAENSYIEEALHHFLASGDTAEAVQLVMDNRHDLLNSSQIIRLERLLAMLPEGVSSEHPLVATTRAFITIEHGNYAGALKWAVQAQKMLDGLSPGARGLRELRAEVLVLNGLMALFSGSPDGGRLYSAEVFGQLPEQAVFMKAYEVGVSSCFHQMRRDRGHVDAMTKEALFNPEWPTNIQARIYFHLCIALYMDGDLSGVMQMVAACRRFVGVAPFHHTRAYAHYFQGVAAYLQNDLKGAEGHMLKVLEIRHTANASYVAEAGFVLSCIYLAWGDETTAELVREQVITHCRQNDHAVAEAVAMAFEVETAVRSDDLLKAKQLCARADFNRRPPLWFFYVPQLTPIKCLLQDGSKEALQQARSRLRLLDGRLREINRINVRIEVSALLALVCGKQGDEVAAADCLETALALAEPGNWVRSFVDLGEPMVTLLDRLIGDGPVRPFAKRVLEACGARSPVLDPSVPRAPAKPQALDQGDVEFLTRRESEIVPLLAEGMSNKEIAGILCVSEGTVKTHLKNIFKKLGANSRIDALNRARESGQFIAN